MTKQEIKVGDRVEVLDESFGVLESGSKGKVVVINQHFIGVELDENIGGHTCIGHAKLGHGRYFYPEELKVIEGE